MAKRLALSSCFSEISGLRMPLSKSWEMAEEIASNRPAAVDKAAAKPPATTSAITQPGSLAISGFAKTMISLSIFDISLPFHPSALNDSFLSL